MIWRRKGNCISGYFGAGDGNRTNPIGQNKGVTARFSIQLESNGVNKIVADCLFAARYCAALRQLADREDFVHLFASRWLPCLTDEYACGGTALQAGVASTV
jgi:hypothetical protein